MKRKTTPADLAEKVAAVLFDLGFESIAEALAAGVRITDDPVVLQDAAQILRQLVIEWKRNAEEEG